MSSLTLNDQRPSAPDVRERESIGGRAGDVPLDLGADSRGYSEFNFRRQPTPTAAEGDQSGDRDAATSAADTGATSADAADVSARTADRPSTDAAPAPDIDDVFGPGGTEFPSFDADVDRIVDRIYKELERKMRIERERRGL